MTTIGGGAFALCNGLVSVTIGDSVTTIGDSAFAGCSSLTGVTIPDSVTTIGGSAFSDCYNLTSVTIPDSVTTIGGEAFYNCTSLTGVTIGNSVTTIGYFAFNLCTSLTSVTFEGSAPEIGSDAFSNVTATCYYPANDTTWTDEVKQNYGGTLTWVAVDEHGEPVVTEKIDFAFARMILGNALDMQFAFPKEGVESGAYVEVIRVGADWSEHAQIIPYEDFKSATIGGVPHFYVTYSGIAAKEMADTILATVYNRNGTAISNGWTDSVREYALRSLRAEGATAKNKTMLVDMLNYGAAAQVYFTYNADDLANCDLTAEELALGTTAQPCVNEVVKGAYNRGSRLILESSIKVQQAFTGLNANMYAVVSYTNHNGKTVTDRIEGSEFQLGAVTVIELDQVALADARTLYTLTIYNADGTVYDTHVDSVASYIARASDNALYDAIMNFADGAYNYFH